VNFTELRWGADVDQFDILPTTNGVIELKRGDGWNGHWRIS
jgi:hypothetical protein